MAIKAEDLQNGKYQVIGLLGKPYGEESVIEGVWNREPEIDKFGKKKKYRQFFFEVTAIDGRPLGNKNIIQFQDGSVFVLKKSSLMNSDAIVLMEYAPRVGKSVSIRAFESGGYSNFVIRYPEWVHKLLDDRQEVQDPLRKEFRFHSFLYLVDDKNSIGRKPSPDR